MSKTYMLDTCICSFIMREQPDAVLKRLEQAVLRNHRIVVPAITYAEMRFGATGPKALPRHVQLVDAFDSCRIPTSHPGDSLRSIP